MTINAGSIKALLHTKFSENGTEKREEEKVSYMHFMDFLDECEGTSYIYFCNKKVQAMYLICQYVYIRGN